MPARPQRPCLSGGCSALTLEGYCPKHKTQTNVYDKTRGSSCKRGYDRKWSAFRAAILRRAEFALCRDHQLRDLFVSATELHHPIKVAEHPELMYDEDNIMPLCKACHSARTAKGE